MKISFEGWARNHGEKVMVHERLIRSMVKEKISLNQGDVQIEIKPSAKRNVNIAKIHFSTNMRLGGDQMGVLTLSVRDLSMLLDACLNEDADSDLSTQIMSA